MKKLSKEQIRELKKRVPKLEQAQKRGITSQKWKENAPRLTEEQKIKLSEITRSVFKRHLGENITRDNFPKVHYLLEDELTNMIAENLGLIAAVEWRGVFASHVSQAFNKSGMANKGFVDGISPTHDFLNSELFDYIEVFQPRVVCMQFDDYTNFMDSAEESISQAEKRRFAGDAYFTNRDRQINWRPGEAPSGAVEETPGDFGEEQ